MENTWVDIDMVQVAHSPRRNIDIGGKASTVGRYKLQDVGIRLQRSMVSRLLSIGDHAITYAVRSAGTHVVSTEKEVEYEAHERCAPCGRGSVCPKE